MACFLVPGGEGIVVSLITKIVGRERAEKLKLRWLSWMLWGGTILLAVEHIWHGEVVPWPPFLTAMANPADTAAMLHEMATIGTSMALTITFVWGIMVYVSNRLSVTIGEKEVVRG
ncbi:hypothetical protein B6U71_04360 [Euryarchaeota archaeon ex4484_178]|nr:MAG: hypothetical protein B6U71_04360 [Euryarchaeota archaeon ex4484_178]